MTIQGKARLLISDRLVVVNELVVDNASLHTDNNDVTADRIIVKNGGYITHLNATTTATYQTVLNATTFLAIDSSSKIDVSSRGYLGGYSGGNSSSNGRTYGNTTTGGSYYSGGGSYGGVGGTYSSHAVNTVYGDPNNPDELGSGGGGYPCCGRVGGNGGGLVKISAGTLTLSGSIIANGGTATVYYAGGGSGGGILLNVGTLTGAGTISANGGANSSGFDSYSGGGGGGRIAIYYTDKAAFAGTVTANGGLGGNGTTLTQNGSTGTIYYEQEANQAPTIDINSPVEGATVTAGTSINVVVDVSDVLSLQEVTFNVSGEATYSEKRDKTFIQTYGTVFNLPIPAGAIQGNVIQITVTAIDDEGNTSQAA